LGTFKLFLSLQKTKFIEKLKDPTVVKLDNDSDELESLVKDYPYFQSGRVLLAKEKYANKALNFEKYIVEAAIHTTDRRSLKKYIEQEIQTINEESNFFDEEEPKKRFSENQRSDNVTKGLDLEKSEVTSEEEQSDEDRLIKEKIAKYRSALDDFSTDTRTDSKEYSKEDTSSPLIEELLLKKEESVIDLNTSPPQSTGQVTDSEEPTSRIDRIISEVQQDMEDLKASKLRFQTVMNKIDGEENGKKSPIQTAKSTEKKTSPISKKKKTNKKKVSDTTAKKVNIASKEKNAKTRVNKTKKSQSKQQDQKIIIDEFIDSNPKIKPIKPSDIKNPTEDLSAKSTEFKPDSSSEYLANIYIEQNKINKAIAIYENLSLKFPEKKSYFVNLIQKLKSK